MLWRKTIERLTLFIENELWMQKKNKLTQNRLKIRFVYYLILSKMNHEKSVIKNEFILYTC